MTLVRGSAGVFAVLGAGCTPGIFVGSVDARFERCGDPVAVAASERATALIQSGQIEDSIPLLRTVVEHSPDFVPGHLRYQDRSREVGGAVEAAMLEFYAKLDDRAPSPLVPFLRARLADHDAERLPLLDLAIARDQSFYFAYLEKAAIMKRLRRTAEALDNLQRAESACSDQPEVNLELADVLAGLGRSREAAEQFARYVAARPDDLLAKRRYLRLLLYSLGRLDEAQKLADELLRSDEHDTVVLMDVAAIAWRRSDFERARVIYRRVLAIDPTRDRAVLNLANLYYEPIAGGSEAGRRAAWPKARAAYRYFIAMRGAEGLFDQLDYHVGVPYRLQQIAELLGPAPEEEPTLGSF